MQNVLAAHVLTQTTSTFAACQVAFALTGALMFLPCALMARLAARRGFRGYGLLAIVLAANPMFFKNATYPWTKALTVDRLRPRHWAGDPGQTWLRVLTDRAFMLYHTNLFFGIGSLMSLAGVWLPVRALRTSWPAALGTRAAALVFLFLGAIVVRGVGIHGARQTTGLAFIALQPLIYMVVVLVVGQIDRLPHWGRVVVFGGVAVDFVFGVDRRAHV